MTPRRVDRAGIRTRLDDVPAWIIEVMLDAFEPAALNYQAERAAKQPPPKSTGPGQQKDGDQDD